jgi:cysteine desulfurase
MLLRNRDIIYIDNNATTQVVPEVVEAMMPFYTELYGNPSSGYRFGSQVAKALQTAREQVALLIDCDPKEVIFTSCGTESDNAAIASALQTTGKRHVVTSNVEHSAIKNQCEHLERQGYAVTRVPVREDGTIDPKEVEKAIRPDTAIVSLMWANNETGVLFPVQEIAHMCKAKEILFHTDAVQTPGKIPLKLKDSAIDFLSLSGHKLHAPKGVGVLFARRRTPFVPYVMGGHQEKGKRGGTENVASIVGLGRAAELALENLAHEQSEVKKLRDEFEKAVLEAIPDARVNGNREQRLPNTSSIAFIGADATAILTSLDQKGVCASAGSACTTGSLQPSHVLTAMKLSRESALGTIRFSFSRLNTKDEVNHVLTVLREIIPHIRQNTPQKNEATEAAVR